MNRFDSMSGTNQATVRGDKERPKCQFCDKPSTNFLFAAFVCDSEDCINKAMDARGGPAGHKKDPKKWLEENK